MNYDKLAEMYIRAYDKRSSFNSDEEFLARLNEQNEQYKQVLDKLFDTFPYKPNIIGKAIANENRQRRENDPGREPVNFSFRKLSSDEKKRRKILHDKSKVVLRDLILNFAHKAAAFDAFNDKPLDRNIKALFVSESNSVEEAANFGKMVRDIEKDNNREKLKNIVMDKVESLKGIIEGFSKIRTNEQLIDFLRKNASSFGTLVEFQPGKMNDFNKRLGLGIPEDFIREWEENYAGIAVDAVKLRLKVSAMANPLYTEYDEIELAGYESTDEFEYATASSLAFNDELEPTNPVLDPLTGMNKCISTINTPKYTELSLGMKNYQQSSETMNLSIQMKLRTMGLDKDLSKYTFKKDDGTVIDKQAACEKILDGENIHLYKDGQYLLRLETSKDVNCTFVVDSANEKEFNMKNDFLEIADKDEQLFEQYVTLKEMQELSPGNGINNQVADIEKKIDKAKNDAFKKLDNKIGDNLKDVYKAMKDENPWYIKNRKGNRTFTEVQNLIGEVIDDKNLTLEEKKAKMELAKQKALEYLQSKVGPNHKDNKHAKAREDAMLSVLGTARNFEKSYKEFEEVENTYELNEILERSKENSLSNRLDNDLEREEVKENVINNVISNERVNVIDNDEIQIEEQVRDIQ